jgi:hypothetical protein
VKLCLLKGCEDECTKERGGPLLVVLRRDILTDSPIKSIFSVRMHDVLIPLNQSMLLLSKLMYVVEGSRKNWYVKT